MIQLIYTSDFAKALSAENFEQILKHAEINNKALNITGMMIVIDQHIFQAFEGPEQNVLSLMELIKADSRHTNVRIISIDTIITRDYPDWTMGHINDWQGTTLDDVKSVLLQLAKVSTFNENNALSLRMLMHSLRPKLSDP